MFIKNLIEKYNEEFHLSARDLADVAESNRLNTLVVSSILLLTDIIDFLLIMILYHSNLQEHTTYLIYLAIYTPLNLYIFMHARHSKRSSYRVKTIPVYLLFLVGISASIFNFYFQNSPHNGFVTYYLAGLLFLILFSVSPIAFLGEIIPVLIILAPGIYRAFGIYSLIDSCVITIVMFCISLYKRHFEKKHIQLLKKQKRNIEAKTFGNFTLLYDGKVIGFSRSKSVELMAYLIYKNGTSVKTKELISVLWGENADSARYGSSLRNLIVDIKRTLKEIEIQNFFISEYNNFRINPEVIQCDYYDFLAGDSATIRSYAGEFMNQYSWAEDNAAFLEQKALTRRR